MSASWKARTRARSAGPTPGICHRCWSPRTATRYIAPARHGIGIDPSVPRFDHTPADTGTTLLLFTDGLVERRDKAIDGTLRALADHCLRLVPTPPDAFCDELLTERARGSTTTPCSPCACPPRPAGEPRGRFPSDTRRRPGGAVAIHAGVSRVRNA